MAEDRVLELGPKMRWLLMACGPMNLGGIATFAPPFPHLRNLVGLSRRRRTAKFHPHPPFPHLRNLVGLPEAHPLYLWVLTAWLPLFGIAYFWMGWTGKADCTFLTVGAAGKATFAIILLALWGNGELPMTAGLVGLPDLVLAVVFAIWLWRARRKGANERQQRHD